MGFSERGFNTLSEHPVFRVVSDPLRLLPLHLLLEQAGVGNVEQAFLGEVADQAGIRPVLDHARRPRLVP